MKAVKQIGALLLVLCMLCTCVAPALALTATEQWEGYYTDFMQKNTGVFINPGSNESQLQFSWYSPVDAPACKVIISTSKAFVKCQTFTGCYDITAEGDRRNKITLTGLEEATTYYYRCFTGNEIVKESTFTTIDTDSFTALYVTDIHITRAEDDLENSLVHQSYTANEIFKEAVNDHGADFVISAGDQASYGDRREYMSLAASPVLSGLPFALCVGNHDRKGVAYKSFNNNPNQFTDGVSSLIGNDYWYTQGNILFMVLDSNNTAALSHRRFMQEAVKANPDAKWRIAVMHHDLYGRLTEGRLEDADENRRPVFTDLFDEFDIDLALLGHSHYYSVSNAVYGGKTVQEFENNTLTNAKGTVYMVSNSINHPRNVAEAEKIPLCQQNHFAVQKEGATYNIIHFTENQISVSSYEPKADEPFYSFTITKTDENNEHSAYKRTPEIIIKQFLLELAAVFTEFGEGVAGIWKNYFDA